ncbi:unnamed protein product [Anisakis simplex]|uniref:SUN domain-containing protein n=1 Tax=Anisakis simplex TaxID=6269 RepID=A0A0M3K9K1_ANISI|nr:unnamed protein product [Anisakis simplex]
MFSIERRQTESAQCDKSSLISASTPVTSFIPITTNSSNLQDRSHYPSNRSAAYSDGPFSPPSSSASSSSCFAISGSARYSSNIVGFRRGADPQSFRCIRLPPADSSGGFMTASNTSRLSRTLAMKRRKRIGTRSLCKYDCRRLSSNQDSDTDISNNYSSNSDDEYDTFNGFTGYDVTKQHLPSDYPLQLLWRFCYCTLFCWFYQCHLWRSYFVLSILLFGGLSPALVMGEYPRVLIMVEKYADEKSSWEFHSRSSRQAEISRKTWNEYVLYKGAYEAIYWSI